jgi:hypothetical protein
MALTLETHRYGITRRRRAESAWIILALLAATLTAAPGLGAQEAAEEIRLGYLLSRSGGYNTHDRAGASMGEDEVNQQAEALGQRFRVVFAQGGHSSEVVEQARLLIEKEGARALLGSVSDAATVALANLAQVPPQCLQHRPQPNHAGPRPGSMGAARQGMEALGDRPGR